MRIFSLATGADTAGIGYGLARAFHAHSSIRLRSMAASPNFLSYPIDVPYGRESLEQLYDTADVVILHNTVHGHDWYDAGQGKPTILMHHGRTPLVHFREQIEAAKAIGAAQIGSTLDLSVFGPVEWIGAPVDRRAMRKLRRGHREGSPLLVGHAPTSRSLKGTDAFIDVMDRLSKRLPVRPVLIEGASWSDCLARKAECDIWFDQPTLGYGSNAIEAWAMGMPVLAGVTDPSVREAMECRWGWLPFLQTTEAQLEENIERLVLDADLRHRYAELGTRHVERWHADASVAERLEAVIRSVGPSTPGGRLRRIPR